MTAATAALAKATNRLVDRLQHLEGRLDQGDEVWAEYMSAAEALARLAAATAPGSHGELLTTKQLAETLHVSTRQVRRLRKSGKIAPAAQLGARTLRWRAETGR